MGEGDTGRAGGVRLLTVAEVAGAMRLSRTAVYRLIQTGRLPGVRDARLGRGVRVPQAAVDDLLRRTLPPDLA
jgi:excisionase family DNA binding protein